MAVERAGRDACGNAAGSNAAMTIARNLRPATRPLTGFPPLVDLARLPTADRAIVFGNLHGR